MEMIKVEDFEKEIVNSYLDEESFLEYLEKNKDKKLDLDFSHFKVKKLNKEEIDSLDEEGVIDYLEEIASLEPKKETSYDDVEQYLPEIAQISFNYLREGVFYLDITQEGVIGLLKALEHYEPNSGIDFQEYKNFWVIREMIIFINDKIINVQNEFISYFKQKKIQLESGEELNSEDASDEIFLTEKDLLPNIEAIEKKEKTAKEKLTFLNLKNRLSEKQIRVLNLYFGFGEERRYSIYEVEEKLNLKKDEGEKIFEEALFILCTVEGKMFI